MGRDQEWLFPAIAIAIAAILTATAINYWTGYLGHPNGVTSLKAAIAVVTVTAFFRFMRFFLGMWRSGEEHPTARLRRELRPALIAFSPIAAGVAILAIFLYSITFLKSMIPAVIPFWADAAFAATDRALFIDSQAIAIALKPALVPLGLFYGLWHGAHLGGILWVLHWRRGNKARHILSFMLTWSIGMFFAFIFSSMGPLFTGQYDLSLAPESVRKPAAFLLSNYETGGALLGGGISAFPSMHVAIAAWFAMVLADRGWPKLGMLYLIGIFACSIILGWHYAVDGIAGAAIAFVADRLARAWLKRRNSIVAAAPEPACAAN